MAKREKTRRKQGQLTLTKTSGTVTGNREKNPGVWRGGETPHMKVVGMLIVSLRGVNLGFWSHLGCSGQNAIIFSSEGLI